MESALSTLSLTNDRALIRLAPHGRSFLAGVDHAHPQCSHAGMLRLTPVLLELFPVPSLRRRLFFLLPLDAYDEELCRYHISPGVLATVLGEA